MFREVDELIRSGDWLEALFATDRALQLHPGNGRWHAYRGLILLQLGRICEAEGSFGRAYILDPQLTRAAIKQAQCLIKLGRRREAMEVVKEALATAPNDTTLQGLHEHLLAYYDSEEHDAWERTRRLESTILTHDD